MKRAIALCAALALSVSAFARDSVNIVGSSTVYPFSTVVAEQFGKSSGSKTPKVEATGSGGGLKLFCAGVGVGHPDVANSSRAIKSSEVKRCASNGVTEIVEVKVGYDGIVLANAKGAVRYELTRRDIFLALAKMVPENPDDPKNSYVLNPYTTWKQVNPALPDVKIEVLGPPPTSGTRDAFVELAMEGGAKTFATLAAMSKTDKAGFKAISHTLREDGAYIEAGENDNLIVQKLQANPDGLGIFGFSFLDQNFDKVQGSLIDGMEPEFDSIADGKYPVSRPLYMYVKKQHVGVVPGLHEFVKAFADDRAWGEEGYLTDKGLIPMPDEERAEMKKRAHDLVTL